MLKQDQLFEALQPARCDNENASSFTYENMQSFLQEAAAANDIPIAFYSEEAKFGGLFSSKRLKCLCIYHPEHKKDYYHFAITIEQTGGAAEIHTFTFGNSKQMKKFALSETGKQQRRGQSLSYKMGNLAMQGLLTLGKSKDKLAAEQGYYDAICQMIEAALS